MNGDRNFTVDFWIDTNHKEHEPDKQHWENIAIKRDSKKIVVYVDGEKYLPWYLNIFRKAWRKVFGKPDLQAKPQRPDAS